MASCWLCGAQSGCECPSRDIVRKFPDSREYLEMQRRHERSVKRQQDVFRPAKWRKDFRFDPTPLT